MSTEPEDTEEQPPAAEYEVTVADLGTVTVIDPEGEPGYRVRLPHAAPYNGQVTAYAAASGDPCEANAAADIAAALAAPNIPAFVEAVKVAVQTMLDTRAQQSGYDDIVSACSYAAAANAFQAEGLAFLAWRSSVWAACYAALAAHNPADPLPSMEAFIATLPALPEV